LGFKGFQIRKYALCPDFDPLEIKIA